MALSTSEIALGAGLAGGFVLAVAIRVRSGRRKRRRTLEQRLKRLQDRTGSKLRSTTGKPLPTAGMRATIAPAVEAKITTRAKAKASKAREGPAAAIVSADTRCVLCHTPIADAHWLPCPAASCGRIAHKNCSTMVDGCPVCQTPY